MPTPPATTFSTSSSAPGACASPRWPCTTFARSSASIGPRGPRQRPPGPARIVRPPSRVPPKRCHRVSPWRCRLPLFLDADAIRGGVPLDADRLGLVGHCRRMFRGRVRLLAAGPVDQHLFLGRRRGTRLPSGRDGRPRLRPVVRRPPLSVAAHRRRLASAPVLARGRCLLPPHLPLALAPQRGRAAELRRAHHPALDQEIPHRQGLRHHAQQVHALRETLLWLRRGQRPFPERARYAGKLWLARAGGADAATSV